MGVADGGIACEDAVALEALVVGARDLVEAGQRASQAHVVVDGHPRVVARPVVVEEVPRARVLNERTHSMCQPKKASRRALHSS